MADRLLDPVCGMLVSVESAAARLDYNGDRYLFCAAGCRDVFLRDPARYLDADGAAARAAAAMREEEARLEQQRCDACGQTAAVLQEAASGRVGIRTIDECVALIRAEWRRRLGHRAYARDHSMRLIRTILVYALLPESAVRRIALEQELVLEVARLRAEGLNRAQVGRELYHLLLAAEKVVAKSGLPEVEAAAMIEALDRGLHDMVMECTVPGGTEPSTDRDGAQVA